MFLWWKMKKLISIKRDKLIKVSSYVKKFTLPTKVYFPIDKSVKLNINAKKIKKGQKLYDLHNASYYSSVSGELSGLIWKKDETNNPTLYLSIINDFKEEKGKLINHNANYYLTTFCSFLLPTLEILKNQKILYFNAIKDDPYDVSVVAYFKENAESLLETLDFLRNYLHSKEVHIFLKENATECIEALSKFLGMYPFISLVFVPDLYPIGDDSVLEEYLKIPNLKTLKIVDLMYLQAAIINNEPLEETYVTISGDLVDEPCIVKVKIGTLAQELINEIKPCQNLSKVWVNGFFKGHLLDLDEVVITAQISSLIFSKEETKKENPCISCGKCLECCPKNCNPIKGERKNCISCGLCTYICPSHINFKERNTYE